MKQDMRIPRVHFVDKPELTELFTMCVSLWCRELYLSPSVLIRLYLSLVAMSICLQALSFYLSLHSHLYDPSLCLDLWVTTSWSENAEVPFSTMNDHYLTPEIGLQKNISLSLRQARTRKREMTPHLLAYCSSGQNSILTRECVSWDFL